MLSKKYYVYTNNMVAYTRQKDIDPIRYRELIMQFVKEQRYIKRADVVELLHVTQPQAYRLLSKLVHEHVLKLDGKGAGSRYILNK